MRTEFIVELLRSHESLQSLCSQSGSGFRLDSWTLWCTWLWLSTHLVTGQQAEVELVPLRANYVPRRVAGSSNSSIC